MPHETLGLILQWDYKPKAIETKNRIFGARNKNQNWAPRLLRLALRFAPLPKLYDICEFQK
jgi:hypothetical protein